MRTLLFIAILCCTSLGDWRIAGPGWRYEWPRDHAAHAGFKTEWWYFTGSLRAEGGRRFGWQLTFFRQGVRPPGSPRAESRFVRDDFAFAHFAVTDVEKGAFHFTQRISRGAFGEAGFGDGAAEPRLAWLGRWTLDLHGDGTMRVRADDAGRALDLTLESTKPFAVHGADGISRKAAGPGRASHYYSATRMRARGTLTLGGREFAVAGESWLDREWATNQLAAEQAGWDWFSAQFDDGTELMLYRLRRRDGTADPASSGSFIAADGTVSHIRGDEMELTPLRRWRSTKSGGEYPVEWRIRVPALALDLQASTPVEAQELVLQPVTYWEGLMDFAGTRGGSAVKGHGYLEMTGYAGELTGLRAAPAK